jgi:uncharacterized membrane protein
MKDRQLEATLARVMLGGTALAAGIILIGLVWYLSTHTDLKAGDHVFTGEPKYFENPISMVHRALDVKEFGHRRSVVMIGVVLLLINPVIRVGFAIFGFAAQKDRLYTAVSGIVLAVLLFSFFW